MPDNADNTKFMAPDSPAPHAGHHTALVADAAGGGSPNKATELACRWQAVTPHREALLRVARRRVATPEDAEDIVQAAMLRAVEHPSFDVARAGAFLTSTVVRLAVDSHRQRAREGLAVAARAMVEDRSVPVDEAILDRAEASWLMARLRLPRRERQLLAARASGLTVEQAAVSLGISHKAAENAYTRLRARARAALASTFGVLAATTLLARRLSRPAVAVPVAAVALTASLSLPGTSPERGTPPVKAMPAQAVDTASRAPLTLPARVRLVTPGRPSSIVAVRRGPTSTRTGAPAVPPPVGHQTAVRLNPPLAQAVGRTLVEGEGVTVTSERQDETFEQSLQRCVARLRLTDPLYDSCR